MRTFVILFSLWSSMALAGDWGSVGGGSILRTEENPWFLSNTRQIRYCVEMDPVYFGQLPTSVGVQIDLAFQFWKLNFAASTIPRIGGSQSALSMATQEFISQPACNSETDIVFYLGQLPPNVGGYISDPRQFVGVVVRTDYDNINLRGRGFVYISADDGPLSYNSQYLRRGAWHLGKGGLLFKVLVHELGHVFGLPHIVENVVMNERFPERVLAPMDSDVIVPWPVFEGINSDGTVAANCVSLVNPDTLDYFDIPLEMRSRFCYRLTYDVKSGTGSLLYGPKIDDAMTVLGTITETGASPEPTLLGGINIWLPSEQIVFPNLKPGTTLRGVQALRRSIVGTFTSAITGRKKQILFELTPINQPKGPSIGGVVNGKVVLDLLN